MPKISILHQPVDRQAPNVSQGCLCLLPNSSFGLLKLHLTCVRCTSLSLWLVSLVKKVLWGFVTVQVDLFRFRCFGFLPYRLSAETLISAKTASFARNKLFWQQIFSQNVGQNKVIWPKEAVSAEKGLSAEILVSAKIMSFSKGLVSVSVFRPKNCFVCPLLAALGRQFSNRQE